MPNYSPYSRLNQKKVKSAYLRIFFATITSIALILGVIFLGIPLAVKFFGIMGNIKSTNEPITNTDTTPPFPPRLEPISEATNSAYLTVKGFSEPGSTVEIFLNGESYKKIVTSSEGTFNSQMTLQEGDNRILAQATDNAKNASQPSESIVINFQKSGPKLDISDPADNADIKSDNHLVTVNGFTNPEATITVNGRFVIVNADGSFSYQIPVNNGSNTIEIIATDQAGNEKKVSRKINYSTP